MQAPATVDNISPVISGVPPLAVKAGEAFSFTPSARDANNDPLTFSIANKPAWAAFDPATGKLSGTPAVTDAGLTPAGYVISVSDGKGGTAKLAAFNVNVITDQPIPNRPPVISGTPATTAKTAQTYSFTPAASDPDNNPLSFSIVNKPAWATFDSATGKLSGTPTVAGISSGITISVSDGNVTATLPAFAISVSSPPDIKLSAFGIASQSTTYQNFPASNAIDGSTSTYNHANCQANDWWQVELKSNPTVSRIVITNRDTSFTAINRLKGATVYVSSVSAASGAANPAEQVATLTGDYVQTITVNPSRAGKYVIVRTAGSNCLHMAEVEVFGQGNDTPVFEQSYYSFITDFKIALQGGSIGLVKGFDYQSDPLSYSFPANIPFSLNAQGSLTAKSTLQPTFYNFTGTVSDGVNSSTAQFSVNATMNLAREFGIAGHAATGNANSRAQNALDGDLNTNSFSPSCDGMNNWWQVKLPAPNRLNRANFTIQSGWGCALNGASVYLSDNPYQSPMDANSKVATLNCDNTQKLNFPTPVSGQYLVVKATGENCITFSEVEVYGEVLQQAPQLSQPSYDFLLANNAALGDQVGVIKAVDYQLNALSFAIQGSVPFTIDNQGAIRLNGAITPDTVYSFNVAVNDGSQSTIVPVKVTTSALDAVPTAIRTGDASRVTAGELLDAGILQAKTEFNYCTSELAKIYPSGLQQTTFTLRTAYEKTTSSRNIPLHASNITGGTPKVYSWLGVKETGSKYAFLGSNVFSFSPNNTELKTSTLNLLRWVMGRDVADDILNEPLIILVPTSEDRGILNTWFTANGLTHKWTITGDTSLLATGRFDLLLAETTRPVTQVQSAFSFNRPVIVFNQWYEPPAAMLQEFDLTWSWYGGQTIGNFTSVADQCTKTYSSSAIHNTLTNLKSGLPDFIYEDTDCPTAGDGKTVCATDQVSDAIGKDINGQAVGHTVNTLFLDGTGMLQSQLRDLDGKGINVFSLGSDKNLLKISTLIADKYRSATRYPIDKVATDDNIFYQTMFSDYLVHYSWPTNFYQPDLGPFSNNQANMSALPTLTKTVTLTPTINSEWTSTGVYLPPGKTITVRRTDTGPAKIKFRGNMLRQTTRLWQTLAYNRPLYLAGNEIALDVGKSYTFSTPYGGPAYIYWDAMPNGGTPFTVEFSNVLDNPLLTKFDVASVQTFLDELKTSLSDWVDIKTAYGELHSKKSLLYNGFDRSDYDTTNGYTLQDAIDYPINLNKYLFKGSYELAGFTNPPDLTLKPELTAFCDRQGLSSVLYNGATTNLCTDKQIHRFPSTQHMNAEIDSFCGGLCSGNPIDFAGSIIPAGYGEGHELGHNLQNSHLKLYEGRTGEVSNNIFGYFMQTRYAADKGLAQPPKLDYPAYESAFNMLQNGIKNGTPPGTTHPLWSDAAYSTNFDRLAFYSQLPYISQTWDVYTKLYIMDRIFLDALGSDAKWNAVKSLLGFGNYSLTDAKAVKGNDFMYVALSVIEQRNYDNYFKAWGILVSQAAKDQVIANGVTAQAPAVFFYVKPKTFPVNIPPYTETIPLDGLSAYVDPTP